MTCNIQVAGLEKEVQTVLEGGLSISNQYDTGNFAYVYGTLGVVICSDGVPTALSCAHVMASSLPGIGQGILEPARRRGGNWPADSIGTVSLAYYGKNNLDVALTPIRGRASNVGTVKGIGKICSFGTAVLNQSVRKTGATTGYTTGDVKSTTLTWTYTDPRLGKITLYNQIKVTNYSSFALPGDSGSAVIDANFNMVGMVVSGVRYYFTVCSPSSDFTKVIPAPISFSKEEDD